MLAAFFFSSFLPLLLPLSIHGSLVQGGYTSSSFFFLLLPFFFSFCFFLLFLLLPSIFLLLFLFVSFFLILAKLIRRVTRPARALLLGLAASSCANLEDLSDAPGWHDLERPSVDISGPGGDAAAASSTEIARGGQTSEGGAIGVRDLPEVAEPIRLVFADVTGLQIMRRLAETTSIEFVAEGDALKSASMSIDIVIVSSADIYDVVAAVAGLAGVTTEWAGKRVTFSRASAGEAIAPNEGVYVLGAGISPELIALARERFDVGCSAVGKLAVCVGAPRDVEKMKSLASLLADERNSFVWSIVETEEDLAAIAKAISVDDQVVVTALGPGRFLVVARDARLRDALAEVVQAVDDGGCRLSMFAPEHLSPDELAAGLVRLGRGFCAEPAASDDFVIWSAPGRVGRELQAVAASIDREKFVARLVVGIRSLNSRASLRADSDNAFLGLPGFSIGDAVEFSGVVSRQSGWRMVDLWFDGEGNAAIQQTDRVEGALIVTDGGAQVRSVENRTVGLDVTASGALGFSGFRGRLTIDDSFLDGQVTLRASCGSFVRLQIGGVVEVCRYWRNQKGLSVALDSVGANRGREAYQVFAGLLPANVGDLAAVRAALGVSR